MLIIPKAEFKGEAQLIKGTNRQVVEINDTGNEMFERILVIIRPEYHHVSGDVVRKEAGRVVRGLMPTGGGKVFKRRRRRKNYNPFSIFEKI